MAVPSCEGWGGGLAKSPGTTWGVMAGGGPDLRPGRSRADLVAGAARAGAGARAVSPLATTADTARIAAPRVLRHVFVRVDVGTAFANVFLSLVRAMWVP